MLGLNPHDLQVYAAALNAATRQRSEETKNYLDYLATKTAVETASGFHKIQRAVVKALRGRV